MHSPYTKHLEATYQILKYLKSTPGKSLLFQKTTQQTIEAYTNADWPGSVIDRRPTSGYCTCIQGNMITWQSKKQNVVAISNEAEYRAMTNGVCEMLWLKRLPVNMPMKLYCNNKAIISIGQNPMQHDHTNHVEIDKHFIKKKIDIGASCMLFVTTTQ